MLPSIIWLLLLLLLDAGGTWAGLTVDYNQVVNLAFDRYYGKRVFDDAPHHNNATLINGALIRKTEGSCGNCVELLGGNVELNGITFQGIPYVAITILMYVKLMNATQSLTLFETIGTPPRSNHMKPQYILQSQNGRIFWFHRNENGTTVFSTFTDEPVLKPRKWSHVAVTYDGLRGLSQIYIDGKLTKEEKADPGVFLSRDWSKYVGIGEEGGQPSLLGYVDEFYIYNRSMLPIEIQSIIDLCQGEKASLVMHIGFDQKKDNVFVDDSGLNNDVTLSRPPVLPGKEPDPIPFVSGSCGGGVQINGPTNDLKLDGKTMRNKPVDAITIALWINVTSIKGIHYLFDTIGAHSQHIHDQYRLIMEEGVVTWSHHNEYDQNIFQVRTDPIVTAVQWFHIVGTYSAQAKKAKVFINGNLNKEGPGSGGLLSQDWDNYAGFGSHPKGDMQAYDILDEIYIYSRELSPYEIKMLYQACNYGDAKKPVSSQVIYFGFDRVSGRTVFDDSGKENNGHLTDLATVTKTSGTCGNGLNLQGGDIMLMGNQIVRKPLFGITFALWVKLNTNRGTQTIFMTINPDAPEYKGVQYLFEIVNGTVTWLHKNEKSNTVFSIKTKTPVVPAGTWTHIAATFKTMGGKSQIFVNGEVKKEEWTGRGTLSQDWNGRVSIGKHYERDGSGKWVGKNPLLGTIDELYIFDRALTPTELNLLGQTCNYKRVVLHFGFEVFDGQVTYDQSGLANNGEVVNGTKADIGKCGKALNLTHGMIKLNGDFFKEKPQKAITISVWVSLNTNRGYHEIFDTIGSRSFHKHDQYNFAIDTGRVIWYHHQEQDKEIFNIETMPLIPARIWTHIVVTYDASEMLAKVYVNGKQVKIKSATGDLSQDWGHFAGVGYRFYRQDHLGGLIDEFIMYNYALSEEEIAFLAKGTCGR